MSPNGRDRKGNGRPRGGERASILLRSFLIQSVWNPRGMQNVGFCFAMLPLLGRFRGEPDAVRDYLKRHLQHFNTNPTLSCYALGAAALAETSGDPAGATDAKRALAGPLGMAGDAMMWWSLRPLAALAGVAAALAGHAWGALVLVVVYNVPHIALRVRGLVVGASRGPAGAREVLGPGSRRAVTLIRGACAFVAGLILALAVGGGGGADIKRLIASFAFFFLAMVALRLRVPLTLIGACGAVGAMAMLVLTGA